MVLMSFFFYHRVIDKSRIYNNIYLLDSHGDRKQRSHNNTHRWEITYLQREFDVSVRGENETKHSRFSVVFANRVSRHSCGVFAHVYCFLQTLTSRRHCRRHTSIYLISTEHHNIVNKLYVYIIIQYLNGKISLFRYNRYNSMCQRSYKVCQPVYIYIYRGGAIDAVTSILVPNNIKILYILFNDVTNPVYRISTLITTYIQVIIIQHKF